MPSVGRKRLRSGAIKSLFEAVKNFVQEPRQVGGKKVNVRKRYALYMKRSEVPYTKSLYTKFLTRSFLYMQLKIINKSNNPLPRYESEQAAGMDIRCHLSEEITLQPMERRLLPTGLFIELPQGYEAQIRPRSGLALKRGLTVLNSPGTIDADYRGEVGIILINLSNEPQTIAPGERICQMVIARHEQPEVVEVEVLSDTERGAGGFGHSGVK